MLWMVFYILCCLFPHGRFCIVSGHSKHCSRKVLGKAQQGTESAGELISQRYSEGRMEIESHLILVWNSHNYNGASLRPTPFRYSCFQRSV